MLRFFGIFTILILLTGSELLAQFKLGGNVSTNISNNIFIADIAPEASYTIDKFSCLFSPFIALQTQTTTNKSTIQTGARAGVEYGIMKQVFAHAEYEYSAAYANSVFLNTAHALPVGAGFEQDLGNKTTAYALILYDVLYKENSSHRTNPVIYRAGVRKNL